MKNVDLARAAALALPGIHFPARFSDGRGGRFVGRHRFRDNMMTFDSSRTTDGQGNNMGRPLGMRCQTHDGRWVDSTGAFLNGELERLDLTAHLPLAAVTWLRDIDPRKDVTIADEVSSFTVSSFGSPGGLGTGSGIGNGKAWIGKVTTQITSISLDIAKITNPLRLWGMELAYTIPELESAAKLGRPVDQQKYDGLQLKHQMDLDEQAYYGDTTTGDTGLVNATLVTNVNNLPVGASGFSTWATKTPDEILADFNTALTSVWATAAWAVIPGRVGLPTTQYGLIATAKVSLAGSMSIKKYIEENNLVTTAGGGKLDIVPMKWCNGAGVGGTIGSQGTVDRMVIYSKEENFVRMPMTMLQRTPLQYDSIWQKTTYFGRIGRVEVVYPETIGYFDGL